MAGMPSARGVEHKGRHGDGSYNNYQNSTFWDSLKKEKEEETVNDSQAAKPRS